MSRTEYMRELDALLQGISKEEREEAMQYYNDYFDDAGSENEEKVIEELGSPAKLAETIRAGINILRFEFTAIKNNRQAAACLCTF